MKEFTVIITDKLNVELFEHLLSKHLQEDLCFATYLPSTGKERTTAILQEIILPNQDERHLHGNVSFTSAYLQRALEIAGKSKMGLVFLHSHVGPGWQGMSFDDEVAEDRISPAAFSVTGLPLLGMTAGTDGAWSARFYQKDHEEKRKYNRRWCESVKVCGKMFSITFNNLLLEPRVDSERQLRTISAWGTQKQNDLSRLKIGIVGLGSVGSMVAEILSRIGVTRFVLIDFDTVEKRNLDRMTNVFSKDVGRSKVDVIKDVIIRSSTSPEVEVTAVEYSICESEGFASSIDCDFLFSCVDRPWPRQVLNFIAFAHLIPVIDGGILVRTNPSNTKMKGADWKSHVSGYAHECLECIGQYTSENAKLEREGFIDDPSYMKDWKGPAIDSHENVFAFSSHLASSLVLHLLNFFIAPSGVSDIGKQMYHFVTGKLDTENHVGCSPNCFFPSVIGRAHQSGTTVYAVHLVAEEKRSRRLIETSNGT